MKLVLTRGFLLKFWLFLFVIDFEYIAAWIYNLFQTITNFP